MNHYTNNIESAISIIESERFRMTRSSQVWGDSEGEMKHFYKFLNEFQKMKEVLKKIQVPMDLIAGFQNIRVKKTLSKRKLKEIWTGVNVPQSPFIHFLDLYQQVIQSFVTITLYENESSRGDLETEVLRQQSYMSCFTEENVSEYHFEEYGKVCFVFSDNDIFNEKDGFEFFKRKIEYIDCKEFDQIDGFSEFLKKSMIDLEPELFNEKYLDKFYENLLKLENNFSTIYSKMCKVSEIYLELQKIDSKLETLTKKNIYLQMRIFQDMKLNKGLFQVSNYIDKECRRLREQKMYDLFYDKKYVDLGLYKGHSQVIGQSLNLVSGFVKSEKFKSDSEFRILALPTHKNDIKERYIEVDIKMKKLQKIIVANDVKNKEEGIEIIREVLKKVNLNVEVLLESEFLNI